MKFNSLYLNICCSRLGDSKRNLWAGIVFFVKIVKKLGGCQGNHYLCIIIKEFVYENRAAVIAECEIVWQ